MIEGQAVGATVLGKDSHDVRLLTGRELVVAMMVAVIRAAAVTEIIADLLASLCTQIVWHIIIYMRETPRLPYHFGFVVTLTQTILPGIRIDGWSAKPILRFHQISLIVQACIAQRTAFVEQSAYP